MTRLARPVALGSLLALPVGYWYLARWLGQFAYRIELSPVTFVAVAAAAVALATATIAAQALWVARRPPATALRAE